MDPDKRVEELIKQLDETAMPVPNIEFEPLTLISKVRKQYLEYLLKILTINYETACKMPGNKTHLPGGIWRCAHSIELDAARSSMVVSLYRQHLLAVMRKLHVATKNKKLFSQLMKSLLDAPLNDKKVQTSGGLKGRSCICKCTCKGSSRKRLSQSKTSPDNVEVHNTIPVNNVCSNDVIQLQVLDKPDPEPDLQQVSKDQVMDKETAMPKDDHITMQLDQIFGGDGYELEDDLFDNLICSNPSTPKMSKDDKALNSTLPLVPAVQEQNAKIRSLDERLAALESVGLRDNFCEETATPKPKVHIDARKWACEVYFRKSRLFNKLDEIRDKNRRKYARIKKRYLSLFGEDTDDEEMISPFDETVEFKKSCRARMAPWITTSLTPYYVNGNIKTKPLFKGVASHLLDIIYECNKFPSYHDVVSFVMDFIKCHPRIRCMADYKSFSIQKNRFN